MSVNGQTTSDEDSDGNSYDTLDNVDSNHDDASDDSDYDGDRLTAIRTKMMITTIMTNTGLGARGGSG